MPEGQAVTAGEMIRRLRESRGMSIADLQRALGVAWSTVNSWEKKGAVPDRNTTALIVDRLQLTPQERIELLEVVSYVPTSSTQPASPRGPTSPRAQPGNGIPVDKQRDAMSDALTRALDTQRHTVMDAIRILDALADGGEAFATVADPDAAARAWLDGAALLRSRGLPVTAGSLAAVLPEVMAGLAGQSAEAKR